MNPPRKNPDQLEPPGQTTLLFRVNTERFGLPLASVLEVFELQSDPLAVPGGPDWLAGILNHQGQVIPAVNAACLLGLPKSSEHGQAILLQQHDEKLVLLVDQIEAPDHFHAPDVPAPETGWARRGNERIRLLDPAKMADELLARLKE